MTCELCERDVKNLTSHHLIPKSRGGRKKLTVELCQPCHSHIHAVFTNHELELQLSDMELLRTHPEMEKFIKWIKKQNPDAKIKVKQSKTRRK